MSRVSAGVPPPHRLRCDPCSAAHLTPPGSARWRWAAPSCRPACLQRDGSGLSRGRGGGCGGRTQECEPASAGAVPGSLQPPLRQRSPADHLDARDDALQAAAARLGQQVHLVCGRARRRRRRRACLVCWLAAVALAGLHPQRQQRNRCSPPAPTATHPPMSTRPMSPKKRMPPRVLASSFSGVARMMSAASSPSTPSRPVSPAGGGSHSTAGREEAVGEEAVGCAGQGDAPAAQ